MTLPKAPSPTNTITFGVRHKLPDLSTWLKSLLGEERSKWGINWTQILITESDRRVMELAQDAAQDRKELIHPAEGNH